MKTPTTIDFHKKIYNDFIIIKTITLLPKFPKTQAGLISIIIFKVSQIGRKVGYENFPKF